MGESEDFVVVKSVVKFEARCTCGWSQVHDTEAAARRDGDGHHQEWHAFYQRARRSVSS